MDSARVLSNIWNWLPAFRAVAETEHLPTASERLHLTSSALSRSIRQLEDAVGHELFNRIGKRLVLNTAGARLLAATQDAMINLGSTLSSITSTPLQGSLRISTLGVLTNEYVLPAMLELKRSHPSLIPTMTNFTPRDANERLARGHIDVAFYYDALDHESLSIDALGTSTASVYCGPSHPLFEAEDTTLSELLTHDFSVPAIGDRGLPMDGWPVEIERKIGMRITLLTTNLHVCLSGALITVLPDVVALPHVEAGRLRRFPFDLIPPIDLYAARRRDERSADAVVDAVKRRVHEVSSMVSAAFDA